MSATKVGIIGAGYWGPNLIRNFYQHEDADLQYVCDLQQERLDHIQARYPDVYTTKSFQEVISSDVEAVIIATPVSTHYALAKQAIAAGKHVLVEKPITCCSEEADELVNMAKDLDLVLMVGHTFIFNPAVVALKEIIRSGEIGKIYYINCTRVNLGLYQPDINVVWDLAPHDVSIILHLLDIDPTSTSARGGKYIKKDIHDVAYISMYFPDDVLADLRVSWLDPCKIRRITIVGSKKMIVYDDIEATNKIMIYDKGVDIQPYTDTYEDFHLAYRYGEAVPYPIKWDEPLRLECTQFLNSIRNRAPIISDGRLGWKIVKILEAADTSLHNGGVQEKIEWEVPQNMPA